jgi:hypothetical protein
MIRFACMTALAVLTIGLALPVDTATAQTRSKNVEKPAKGLGTISKPTGRIDLKPGPNSTPQGGLPGTGYCASTGGAGGASKKIVFAVQNFGTINSGPGKYRVKFDHVPTPQVFSFGGMNANGGGILKILDIPAAAWKNKEARFTIEVDHEHKIKESNENNNKAMGKCIQPAG